MFFVTIPYLSVEWAVLEVQGSMNQRGFATCELADVSFDSYRLERRASCLKIPKMVAVVLVLCE